MFEWTVSQFFRYLLYRHLSNTHSYMFKLFSPTCKCLACVLQAELISSVRQCASCECEDCQTFLYFSAKALCCWSYSKYLTEILQMSTNNICFHKEVRKIWIFFSWKKKCHIWSYMFITKLTGSYKGCLLPKSNGISSKSLYNQITDCDM